MMPRPPKPPPRPAPLLDRLSPLSLEEEAQLMAALPAWARPVVALALATGLRFSELRRQAWRDIDRVTGRLRVTWPKEGRSTVLPLTPAALALLAALPQEGPWLFPTCPTT